MTCSARPQRRAPGGGSPAGTINDLAEEEDLGKVRKRVGVGVDEVARLGILDRFAGQLLGGLELTTTRQDLRRVPRQTM